MRNGTSIRRKVRLMLFVAFALALGTAAVALTLFEYRSAETRARSALASLADTLAFSLVASLDFDQPVVAQENLSRLEPSRAVLGAAVFQQNGDGPTRAFAHYHRAGSTLRFSQELRPEGFYRDADRALLVVALRSEDRLAGWLLLETDVGAFRRGLRESLAILGVVLLVLTIASFVVSRLLQHAITAPIVQLAETAARVRATGDFSVRAQVSGADEVGGLATAFNNMLAGIAERDREIAANHAMQSAILAGTGVAVIGCDPNGCVRTFNPAAERLLGYAAAEVVGQVNPGVWHDPGEMAARAAELSRELGRAVKADFEVFVARTSRHQSEGRQWNFVRKDGTRVPVWLIVSALFGPTEAVVGYVGLATDLTERKATETALRDSEERYRILAESASVGILVHQNGIVRYANRGVARLTGVDEPAQLVGRSVLDFIEAEEHAGVRERWSEMEAGRLPGTSKAFRLVRPSGPAIWVEAIPAFIQWNGQRAVQIFVLDVTQQRVAEEALRESEARFRRLTENAPDVIFRYRLDTTPGRCEFISAAVERIIGYRPDEFYADSYLPLKIVHPDDRAGLADLIERRVLPPSVAQIRWLARDGRVVVTDQRFVPVLSAQGKLIALEGIARDVTEVMAEAERRRTLELQLIQAQKMESIGSLAGGIAHDFNNILTGILGFTELAQIELGGGTRAKNSLDEVRKAGLRAKDLVAQILTFSRQQEARQTPLDLSRVVAEALKFLRSSTPATIAIERQLYSCTIAGDPTQIHQVVLNLCTNAVHAMRGRSGTLEVGVERVVVDEALAAAVPKIGPGPHARLTVTDTGHGMDEQTLNRIFDPFFTTKPVGEGTGLGLSVVQGIVATHRGGITVESAAGRGTTFRLYFPICNRTEAESASQAPVMRGQGQTILVVDDENSVATFAGVRLQQLNYRPMIFNDPRRALTAVQNAPARFAAIVTDLTMPGMTGLELLHDARRFSANLPAVIITGNRAGLPSNGDLAGCSVLDKPFSGDDLGRALHALLAKPTPS